MIAYKVKLEPDDNDTLLVTSPELPGLVTYGEDRAGALTHAVGALEELIASEIADGRDMPRPRGTTRLKRDGALVALPALSALKLELYWGAARVQDYPRRVGAPAFLESGIGRSVVPARPCLAPRSTRSSV